MHYEIKVISATTATIQIQYMKEFIDGTKVYFTNGYYHRADGPAVERSDGALMWYIYGQRLSEEKEDILNKWWKNKNGL